MKYSKIFQYAYLVFAVLFIYDGITKWSSGASNSAYVSFGLAALAIFMYFFRRKFAKKYDNTNNSK
ncbi:LPXTG cell wall anchor domain-containing protein [Mariniflexile gromovii]|uniref:LPXTG cell wall anchor domain-containing protein n=1 Tax=Mariniflexile gromovii TaxID=362523 RepID=A0ABS4BY24_9FLAO|nr:LPXTG cell wall anchor domain-containing protein [Mariniflexile gromovii]MBP0905483.1 LPXTG cell wall anchor domain-containing protein [Mariniflexile gromovii]